MKRYSRISFRFGFTLLEVILSIAILATLTMAFSTMMQSSFNIRRALSSDGTVSHRLATAMSQIGGDIEHGFLVPTKDIPRNGVSRRMKTIFKLDFGSDSDKLALTSMNFRSTTANANEGDAAYIVYEVRESKINNGRKDLFRGANPVIPEDFKEDPPMFILAKNIKSLKIFAWNGEDWAKDRWDSSRTDWKDRLPRMVRVEITGWARELEEGSDPNSNRPADDEDVVTLRTVVTIPQAFELGPESKKVASIRWF